MMTVDLETVYLSSTGYVPLSHQWGGGYIVMIESHNGNSLVEVEEGPIVFDTVQSCVDDQIVAEGEVPEEVTVPSDGWLMRK